MRAVIQRVNHASVRIEGEVHAAVGKGLLIFLGIEDADNHDDIQWLAAKIARLRIFDDEQGVMNLSAQEVGAEILIISQFTLHASTRKGNRPSYIKSAKPPKAVPLYEDFIRQMQQEINNKVASGVFGAEMKVSLENDGPVTILIDTQNKE
ncbi:MAG: D-aminoacyl-tRNA deacylase [Bacteroidales bacterium]